MTTPTPTPEHASSRRIYWLGIAAPVVIFGLFFLHAWLMVGPQLLYHYQSPIFLTTFAFFKGFLGTPGGPADYASAFLSQLFYYPWAGALVITAVAWLVCLLTRMFLASVAGGRVSGWLSYSPALLLVMLHGRYDYRLLPSVALLAGLLFANLYARAPGGAWRRLAVFAALYALLYYLAGGICVLFAVLCGIFELAGKRQVVPGIVCLVLAPALPLAFAMYSFDAGTAEAFVNLTPYRDVYPTMRTGPGAAPAALEGSLRVLSILHGALMLFFPVAVLVAALRRRRENTEPAEWTPAFLGAFLLAGILLTCLEFNPGARKQILVDYCAERGDWEGVLAAAREVPGDDYSVYVMHEVNRALYRTGRLSEEMLTFPQFDHPPSVHLGPGEMSGLGYEKLAELSLELGSVNFAEHWGHVALEIEGPAPRVLMLLARTHLLLGRPEAAKNFLAVLAENFLYRDRAERFSRAIDAEPVAANDPELRRIRSVMLDRDYGYGGLGSYSYEEMFAQYFRTNPRNRMAFEYLMAFCLLTRDLDDLAANIGRLDDFDTKGIPRLYEEALLVRAGEHPARPADLRGRTISARSQERFREFLADLQRWASARGAAKLDARRALAVKWGDSYFYFSVFSFSEPRPGWRMPASAARAGATK